MTGETRVPGQSLTCREGLPGEIHQNLKGLDRTTLKVSTPCLQHDERTSHRLSDSRLALLNTVSESTALSGGRDDMARTTPIPTKLLHL